MGSCIAIVVKFMPSAPPIDPFWKPLDRSAIAVLRSPISMAAPPPMVVVELRLVLGGGSMVISKTMFSDMAQEGRNVASNVAFKEVIHVNSSSYLGDDTGLDLVVDRLLPSEQEIEHAGCWVEIVLSVYLRVQGRNVTVVCRQHCEGIRGEIDVVW